MDNINAWLEQVQPVGSEPYTQLLLNDLNILTIDTFLVFNLAALACRRDIAMPGLIHRTVLGTGPNHFYSWIEVDINPPRLSQRLNPTQGRRIVERPDLIRLEIGQ